ncbi:hypothetical protein ACI3KS_05205 [Microbacterium sp. ZW T5_45]|uniref:hypothetical protein n=1 Tax=Microbacterium sp. ZW T5_45 TaxID=3378080 RepID=UPI003853A600
MSTQPTFTLDAEGLLSKWGFGDGDALDDWWWDNFDEEPPFNDHDMLHALVVTYLVPAICDAAREVEVFRLETIHNPVRARTLDRVEVDHYSTQDRRIDPPITVAVTKQQILDLAESTNHEKEQP